MHTEQTRIFNIELKKGFDYIDDFKTWPSWYSGMTHIIDPETGMWDAPGDRVRFGYKLLGRKLEGVAILEELQEAKLASFRTEVPGLPVIHFAYHYKEMEPDAFEVRVEMDTEEPTSFFGKSIDRLLLPKLIERDLARSLENLDEIFSARMLE